MIGTFNSSIPPHVVGILALVLGLMTSLCAVPAQAQVTIEYDGSSLVIQNAGFSAQRAEKSSGKTTGGWTVEDQVGNSYQAACHQSCSQNLDGSWTCSGFESSDGASQNVIDGYDDALQFLVDNYGAVIEHDDVSDLDFVSFPDAEDPYAVLAHALLNEELNGRPLVDYFKSIELNSLGENGAGYRAAKPRRGNERFPNDPYYSNQWNVSEINLLEAQLVDIGDRRDDPIRLAILDAGINESDARHGGLDGVAGIVHEWTAPATGHSDQHGLAVTTMLADKGNDGEGPVGLVGTFDARFGSYPTAFGRQPVEILSYSVGAWGPMSNFVVSALHHAVKEGEADIILMNFRMAYSPHIEEAIKEAVASGAIVIAAAGNYDRRHRTKPVGFPASLDGVVSVGSGGKNKKVSDFSAVGSDILAPGESIILGISGNTWVYGNGTSFAAPHVAAVAALVKIADRDVTSTEFEEILQESASGRRSAWSRGNNRGNRDDTGFLDAYAAVNEAIHDDSGHAGGGWWGNDDDDDDDDGGWGSSGGDSDDDDDDDGGWGSSGGDSDDDDDGDGGSCWATAWFSWGECGWGKSGEATQEVPTEARLLGNYPNPFNPQTEIGFLSPTDGTATLRVVDMLGREVHVEEIEAAAGANSVTFAADHLRTGTYVYQILTEEWSLSGRMLLLK